MEADKNFIYTEKEKKYILHVYEQIKQSALYHIINNAEQDDNWFDNAKEEFYDAYAEHFVQNVRSKALIFGKKQSKERVAFALENLIKVCFEKDIELKKYCINKDDKHESIIVVCHAMSPITHITTFKTENGEYQVEMNEDCKIIKTKGDGQELDYLIDQARKHIERHHDWRLVYNCVGKRNKEQEVIIFVADKSETAQDFIKEHLSSDNLVTL